MATDDEQGEVTVTVTHPEGQSLFFTENIIQFLMNRPHKQRPFYLGHWLESLDNAALGRLIELAERAVMNLAADDPVAFDGEDDMLGVVIHALAVETQSQQISLKDHHIRLAALCYLASMEEARRMGWIKLKEGVFSLSDPDLGVAEITEKGFREMPDVYRRAAH